MGTVDSKCAYVEGITENEKDKEGTRIDSRSEDEPHTSRSY